MSIENSFRECHHNVFPVYKCAISPDGTRIYVTDNSHDSLLTLSLDGTVQSTLDDYAHRDPIGVHVSETGQLLVCCCATHEVSQVVGEEEIVTLASQEDGLHHT
ncbi:hypothetical protein DPMN_044381 [Dreissena polymorpha]|uniref:Uncharacterized protein n=1 Tax=Dreissena polymorpha TaxID=45954 RepID=A0A9D4I0G7_DREPO|nr:hypothetical protein DPMN_044381 [Dreissena polymorpha]